MDLFPRPRQTRDKFRKLRDAGRSRVSVPKNASSNSSVRSSRKSAPRCTRLRLRPPPPPNMSLKPKNSLKMSPRSWNPAPSNPPPWPAPAQSRMAIAVVDRALFRVGEDGISLADLLEFFLGIGIIGIAVWMMLQGQLAVRTLQFNFCDRTGYAQHLVVIAFCVRRQNMPFPSGNLRKKFKELVHYFERGLLATFTIAGRNKRSLNL